MSNTPSPALAVEATSSTGQPSRRAVIVGGGTIGRWANNDLHLPDPQRRVGRLQAVLRHTGAGWELENLGGPADLLVNDVLLVRGKRAAVLPGDVIELGSWQLRAGLPNNNSVAAPSEVTPASQDVFSDLFGPGSLPIGGAGVAIAAAADVMAAAPHTRDTPEFKAAPAVGGFSNPSNPAVHPFHLDSAMARNDADPLAQFAAPLELSQINASETDPLALFAQADPSVPHIMSDTRPTTMRDTPADPLDPHRPN